MKYALRLFSLLTILAAGFMFFTSHAHAATFDVEAGLGDSETNSHCSLAEAIQNINDQVTTYIDCEPVGGYGVSDTINLPSGIITLNSDLPSIQHSLIIQGQGMNDSIIDGDGQYEVFNNGDNSTYNDASISLQGMTLTAWSGMLIRTGRGNVSLTNIEIDGNGANVGDEGVMIIGNIYPEANNVNLENIYIHDITANSSYIHILNVWSKGGGTTNALADGITINNVSNTGGGVNVMVWGVGVMRTEDAYGTFNGIVRNTTINDISSSAGIATMVSFSAVTVQNESTTTELAVENSTISNINSSPSVFGVDGSFGSFATSYDNTTIADANLTTKNVVINNNLFNSDSQSCSTDGNLNNVFGGSGTVITSITSLGGNISDDASCNSFFTHPTDQTEVSDLASTLGPLGNNGGLVPTIPLLSGSPAIDSGVTVPGLTADARGVTRPQCAAFDSGAYEYSGTCPATSSEPLTYPDPEKGSTVSLVLPEDVTSPSVSAVDPDIIPKDGDSQFPAGLTTFQFTTTPGATKTVTLYYDLPGSPSSYTARKYKTNTQTFIDVPSATITREDYNGKPMLKLTYQITDGGILDQDGVANGTVIDPVGLATTSLASTGENLWLYIACIMALVGGGVGVHRRFAQQASIASIWQPPYNRRYQLCSKPLPEILRPASYSRRNRRT